MAIMYENDLNVAAFAAMIATDGELLGYIKLDHILKRKNSWNENEREAKESDMDILKRFIAERRPHCIVVGAADRAAIHLREDLQSVVQDLVQDQEFPKIGVHFMDDNLSKVYAASSRAERDFREFPVVLRQAVSLARRMQVRKYDMKCFVMSYFSFS